MLSWVHCRPADGAPQPDEEPIDRVGRIPARPSDLRAMLRPLTKPATPIPLTEPTARRRHLGIPRTAALVTFVGALVVCGFAQAAVPGQRLVDYVASHAQRDDRPAVRGVRFDGGHVAVVNGRAVVRGVDAVVLTSLPDTAAGSYAAQRLCAIAAVGVKRLSLRMVGSVEVRARDGVARAMSLVLGLPSCHRVT